MKAMIFAAGLGTRLQPYTNQYPKALAPLAGKPMLEYLILRLKKFGIEEIIINVHHFAEQIIHFLHERNDFDIRIEVSDEKDNLLETGGGLKNASWFFTDGEPFILHNVDVMSNLDFGQMLDFHHSRNAMVTLAVSKRDSSRYFLFNKEMQLCGWEHQGTNRSILCHDPGYELSKYAFSGIHIIDPGIFKLMIEDGRFSLIDVYLRLAGKHPMVGMVHSSDDWIDLGRPSDLRKAEGLLLEGKFCIEP